MLITVTRSGGPIIAEYHSEVFPRYGETVNGLKVTNVVWNIRPDSDAHTDSYEHDADLDRIRRVTVTIDREDNSM
jgi:hypothetical protein